jgi:predicted nucleic acid-binding protein
LLLELYPLRAADALQLAAALDYFEKSPKGNVFITADQRLADAARQSGFSVEFL